MPRFVVLFHEIQDSSENESHWDLMLEPHKFHSSEGKLLTWRLSAEPPMNGEVTSAIRLADHRLEYLEYEGPLTENRGTVRRIWNGNLRWECSESPLLVAHITSSEGEFRLTITESENQRCWIEFESPGSD